MSYLIGENKMSCDLQRFHDMLSRQSDIEKEKILEFNKNNPPHTEIIIPSNEFDDEITIGMWFVDGAVLVWKQIKNWL